MIDVISHVHIPNPYRKDCVSDYFLLKHNTKNITLLQTEQLGSVLPVLTSVTIIRYLG